VSCAALPLTFNADELLFAGSASRDSSRERAPCRAELSDRREGASAMLRSAV